MSWQCPNCLHHTADGQKHECINDAYDAVVKERDELLERHQRGTIELMQLRIEERETLEKEKAKLTEQVEAFRAALEHLESMTCDADEHRELAREVLAKWPKGE